MIYNELIERGSENFPIELYILDENHPRYEMSFHWHSEIEFIRIISGKLNVKLNSNEYLAQKGDIIFINPETVHGAIPDGECVYECIVMRLDVLNVADEGCRFFIDSLINKEIVINEYNRNAPKSFCASANNLFDSMRATSHGYKFSVISALYSLFASIIDNGMYTSVAPAQMLPKNKNLPKLKKVLAYIRENYATQITLQSMAEKANMSQKYFCSFFKEMTSKTPMEYLMIYRIECGARKLRNTDMSVTEVALSCGFNDLSYFIKTFKRIKGYTPSKFKNM